MQHDQPGIGGQPALDELGAVDDDVVADHRNQRRERELLKLVQPVNERDRILDGQLRTRADVKWVV